MQDWNQIDGIGYEIKVINCTKPDYVFFKMLKNSI